MSGTLDYWNIDLHSPITSNSYGIIYGCYNFDGSNPTYDPLNANCQKIARSGGSLYIFANYTNQQKAQLSGLDLAFNWALDLHDTVDADPMWGGLLFNLSGTYLDQYTVTFNANGTPINFAGTIGATAPLGLSTDSSIPRWKGQLTATWHIGDGNFSTRFTWVDGMKNNLSATGWSGLPFGIGPVTGTPAKIYIDLFGDYAITPEIALRAGVLNVADSQPPAYNPSEQDGTNPAQYDIVGRRYFVGLGVKL